MFIFTGSVKNESKSTVSGMHDLFCSFRCPKYKRPLTQTTPQISDQSIWPGEKPAVDEA